MPALLCLTGLACERQGAANAAAPVVPPAKGPPAPPVAASGRIEGRVRMEGTLPVLPPLTLSPTVERECGKQLPDRTLRFGEGGAIEGAVISIVAPASPGAAGEVTLDQRRCTFEPAVLAARTGGVLLVRNSDPLIHNVRADAQARQLFNVGMPLEGMVTKKPLPTSPSVVDIQCDIHPWMRAWVKTFDHPYFTLSAADGRFQLQGVPAGRQQLVFWHPRVGERRMEVEVPSGGTVVQELVIPAPTIP